MSGSPCTKFIPAIMATLFMSSLGDNRGDWGERLTGIHKTDLLLLLLSHFSHV